MPWACSLPSDRDAERGRWRNACADEAGRDAGGPHTALDAAQSAPKGTSTSRSPYSDILTVLSDVMCCASDANHDARRALWTSGRVPGGAP